MKSFIALVGAVAVLTGATSASAAVRYAAPDATGAEPCALAAPCNLLKAVNSAASGDEIVVQSGVHVLQALDSQALNPAGLTLNIHGASGQTRPTIISGSSLGLKLGTNSTFANVDYSGAPLTTSGTVTIHDAVIENANVLIENGSGSKLYNVMVRHGRLTLNNSTNAVLNHVTVYNASAINAVAMAINAPSAPVDVVVSNTILSGFTDLTTQGNSPTNSVTAHFDHSAFRTPTGGDISNATIVDGGGNITFSSFALGTDPHQHVSNASPTIDAGAAVAGFTPTLTTDVHGNPRVIGSAPDMGAEEFRFRPDVKAVGDATPSGTWVQVTIVPNEGPATYYVEYGTTTSYGSKTATVTMAELYSQSFGVPVSGLTPGVRYHARLVATNPNGTTRSQDVTFTPITGQEALKTASAIVGSQRIQVTPDELNGNFGQVGASKDGTKVWFATSTAITGTGDADTATDLYQWQQGQPIRLLSGSGQNLGVSLRGASDDGSRIFFDSTEAIAGTGDTDNGNPDIYMASGGQIQLVSDPAGSATYLASVADGSRVAYISQPPVPGGFAALVVKDVGGSAHPIGDAMYPQDWCGMNAAGTRVLFDTTAPLVAGDTDTARDTYEWVDGTYRLISGGTLDIGVICRAASATGDLVWFTTKERLLPSDLDADEDTYERRLDGTLRLLAPDEHVVPNSSLNSLAQPHSQIVIDDNPAHQMIAVADNGSRHWFTDTTLPEDPMLVQGDASGARRVLSSNNYGRYVTALPDGSTVFFTDRGSYWEAYGGYRRSIEQLRAVSDDGVRLTVQSGANYLFQVVRPPRQAVTTKIVRPAGTPALKCQATPSDTAVVVANWTRNGVALPATGDYLPWPRDAGQSMRCILHYTNNYGEQGVAVSAPYVMAPWVTAKTLITGARVTGNKLRCSATVAGATSMTYAWYRGTTKVGTALTFAIPSSYLGRTVRCVAIAKNAGGAVTAPSPTITIPVRCTVPTVRGATIALARLRLDNAGCRTKLVYVSTTAVARGRALSTTPAAGSVRPNGTTITLSARRP